MNVSNYWFFFLVFLLGLQACEADKGKDIPDVSAIPVELSVQRFEQDLFALDTNNLATELPALREKYGEFADLFFGQIMNTQAAAETPEEELAYIRDFISHPDVRQLADTVQARYPGTEALAEDLAEAFRFYKYYFPEEPLSEEVVTYLSGYSLGGFLYGENAIGIGLDFYLGADHPYAAYFPTNPNFSQYLTRTFNRDHLVMKTMKLLVQDQLGQPRGNRLLDHMIHNGKELYILDQLLPRAPDSVRLEYSQAQVDWVNENEANIWAYFLAEDLLYSSNFREYRKLVEYSPNSPGMPAEAPGRTANWLGWQIVRAYMERHPETDLKTLMTLDAQKVLDGSRYKPRR